MEMQSGFLLLALNYLKLNPDVAGVGGKLLDTSIKTAEGKRRYSIAAAQRQTMKVSDLGGGGLYRREAVDSVGYLAHRWLPACEEAELGARLRAAGWRLIRLSDTAAFHTGYSESNFQMFNRLWRNRRMQAYGMYLRTAFRRPWWWLSVRQLWPIFAAPILHVAAVILAIGAVYLEVITIEPSLIASEFIIWLGVVAALAVRKKSVPDALLSVYEWNCYAVAAILGFMRSIPDPMIPIKARELTKH